MTEPSFPLSPGYGAVFSRNQRDLNCPGSRRQCPWGQGRRIGRRVRRAGRDGQVGGVESAGRAIGWERGGKIRSYHGRNSGNAACEISSSLLKWLVSPYRPALSGAAVSCLRGVPGQLGRSQAVRQRILIPPFGGSIPPAPASNNVLILL